MDPASIIAQQAAPMAPEAPAPAPEYPEKGNFVEFPVPKDFTPPDNLNPGDVFQALGTFRMKDDSTMCLVAVDGSVVSAPEKAAPPEEKEPETTPEALKKNLPATGLPA